MNEKKYSKWDRVVTPPPSKDKQHILKMKIARLGDLPQRSTGSTLLEGKFKANISAAQKLFAEFHCQE